MKANELMIGDYVTFSDCIDNPPVIPIEIVALGYQYGGGEESSLVRINNDTACDIIDIDDEIVGIPLTPEILEKNGWERDRAYWTYKVDENTHLEYYFGMGECRLERITLIVDEWENHSTTRNITFWCECVYYVHILQHALRFCGIDKEIVL